MDLLSITRGPFPVSNSICDHSLIWIWDWLVFHIQLNCTVVSQRISPLLLKASMWVLKRIGQQPDTNWAWVRVPLQNVWTPGIWCDLQVVTWLKWYVLIIHQGIILTDTYPTVSITSAPRISDVRNPSRPPKHRLVQPHGLQRLIIRPGTGIRHWWP